MNKNGNKILWILNHYAQEPAGPGGNRHFSYCHHLSRKQWSPYIIGASVDHFTKKQRLNKGEKTRLSSHLGVHFLWIKTPEYKGNSIGRILNILSYTWRVLKRSTVRELPKPDIIIGSSVHPLAAWAGARLARRYRVPFLFEVRDLWPETLINMGKLSRRSPISKFLLYLETYLYKQSSRILTLQPLAKLYIQSLGIREDKTIWLPNGIDLDRYPTPAKNSVSNNAFTIMYLGAHGLANDLEYLIQAIHILNQIEPQGNFHFRMVGDGILKNHLISMAENLNITNISFEPPVPKSDVPGVASEADAFVITVKDMPGLYKYGISMNKIFDYMAAAKPIIISLDAEYNPIHEARAGITVPPADSDALARAFLELSRLSPEKRQEMGRNGRHYVEEHHDYARLSSLFADILEQVDNEHRSRVKTTGRSAD